MSETKRLEKLPYPKQRRSEGGWQQSLAPPPSSLFKKQKLEKSGLKCFWGGKFSKFLRTLLRWTQQRSKSRPPPFEDHLTRLQPWGSSEGEEEGGSDFRFSHDRKFLVGIWLKKKQRMKNICLIFQLASRENTENAARKQLNHFHTSNSTTALWQFVCNWLTEMLLTKFYLPPPPTSAQYTNVPRSAQHTYYMYYADKIWRPHRVARADRLHDRARRLTKRVENKAPPGASKLLLKYNVSHIYFTLPWKFKKVL